MRFDDALPERFLGVSSEQEARKLRIDRGPVAPSPYIVKLTREEVVASPAVVTAEIEELAKSLIIDREDGEDEYEAAHDNDLALDALDISSQLQAFDTSIPFQAPYIAREKKDFHVQPTISLDDALERLAEPSISLEALVPIAPGKEEDPEAVIAEQFEQQEASPWVIVSRKEAEVSPSIPRRVLRFEWGVLQHASLRAIAAFALFSFVIVLPLQAMQTFSGSVDSVSQIQNDGIAALDDVAQATAALSAKDFGVAETSFSSAAEKFSHAQETLDGMHAGVVALVNVIPQTNRTYSSVRELITAGQELSQTASIMSKAGDGLVSDRASDVVTKLEVLSAYVESALPHAQAAQAALEKVDPSIVPANYMEQVATLQAQVPELAQSLDEFSRFTDVLSYLLGGDQTMRYLALFQNNTELRPTGGFVGSFAELDISNGEIVDMHLPGGGTYDVQGQLDAFVSAPEPIALINPRWEFQDGNWFPDFPTSAKKMQWFYEHASGPTTDGVIAVNATFMEKLLAVVGPIEMSEYGVTIDAENFLFTTEKIVEVDHGTTATPKAFLGDLAPKILEKIEAGDVKTLLAVMVAVEEGLEEREIQVYFKDNDAQRVMQELGYDGAIAQTSGDYFMMIDTNLGGGKTDAVIDQDISVNVDISDSGSIVDNVTVTKTHRGMANALFTGKNNVDYVRFYVPEGSVLLSADGFEAPPSKLFEASEFSLAEDDDLSLVESSRTRDAITGLDIWNEFGKTVFGGWMQTAPGETQIVHISYRIPQVLFSSDADRSLLAQARRTLGFDNHDGYSMVIQKQSGVTTRTTTVNVSTPVAWRTLWTNVTTDNERTVIADGSHDVFSGWIFTR